MPTELPTAALMVRVHRETTFYEAAWRYRGRLIKRRVGPAWLARDPTTGAWRRRSGRVPPGSYDEARAHVAAERLVKAHAAEADEDERAVRERRERGATFCEVADAYLGWLAKTNKAKPSTLSDSGYLLGRVVATLGDRPAAKISTREIEDLLGEIAATGVSARRVNKYRATISAAYNYACRGSTLGLVVNPAAATDKRREPERGPLVYYTGPEVEALARALSDGLHRGTRRPVVSEDLRRHHRAQDQQDAELVRVAAYAGLRLGELLALRWQDVDFAGSALTVSRAMSAGVETSTKSGKVRRVPLADQAAAALDRLTKRDHFTTPADLVFCNELGRTLDSWSLRHRFKRAQAAAGVRPLRFHDLRHSYGSMLAAAGVDLVTIKAAMGHSAIATTEIYLHARPAAAQAQVFTAAFNSSPADAFVAAPSRD